VTGVQTCALPISILTQFNISDILVSEKDKEGITLKEYTKKYGVLV
jgi:hypothetical protein